jgi:hypothetical protein
MATTAPKKAVDTNSTTTKIVNLLEEIVSKLDTHIAQTSMTNHELLKKLTELEVKAAQGGGGKGGSRGAGGSKAATSGPKKKFPLNTLAWFKEEYCKGDAEKDYLITEFLPEDAREKLEKHMSTSAEDQEKEGNARDLAEVIFLWNTYVKEHPNRFKKIKDCFEKKKTEAAAAAKAGASNVSKEEDETEPGDKN